MTSLLRGYGHQVSALDVANQSLTDSVVPQLFDGKSIPFDDSSFDVALLLTVLHHCHDPDRLLGEASRVARQVFVIEDVYRGRLQKALTLAADSVLNVEFRGHPHNNRSVDQWLATFERLALSGTQVASWPVAGIFRQSLFRVARS